MGIVREVKPGAVTVMYDNGEKEMIELYDNYPLNRKSYWHQMPTIQPGQAFEKGQMLAKSNYTDQDRAVALGRNLRVAYTPYAGANFEDAIVISESAAKKLTSESIYKHSLERNDRTRMGLKAHQSIFACKFAPEQLARMTEEGVVKPGRAVR
ncbi:MAG: hypothetical protein R3B84_20835 [Zavarzinella sp.]